MTNTSGHTIFVPLWEKTSIWLTEAPTFEVLDRNGTDNNGVRFALPNPDINGDGTTSYSVFARALGKPDGKSVTTTWRDGYAGDRRSLRRQLDVVLPEHGRVFPAQVRAQQVMSLAAPSLT